MEESSGDRPRCPRCSQLIGATCIVGPGSVFVSPCGHQVPDSVLDDHLRTPAHGSVHGGEEASVASAEK